MARILSDKWQTQPSDHVHINIYLYIDYTHSQCNQFVHKNACFFLVSLMRFKSIGMITIISFISNIKQRDRCDNNATALCTNKQKMPKMLSGELRLMNSCSVTQTHYLFSVCTFLVYQCFFFLSVFLFFWLSEGFRFVFDDTSSPAIFISIFGVCVHERASHSHYTHIC